MEQERLPIVQAMIMANTTEEREKQLAKLLPIQRGDFEGIFKEMAGLPVIIRLIDPPLHEFLPSLEELIRETTHLKDTGENPALLAEREKGLARVEEVPQTTFGFCRDDAERAFIVRYLEQKILPRNPFETIDEAGVGRLMALAVKEGRKTRPGLEVGICGEHGGDPDSIHLCHKLGLNYVSCSPFRVPVARLAAAQAAIGEGTGTK